MQKGKTIEILEEDFSKIQTDLRNYQTKYCIVEKIFQSEFSPQVIKEIEELILNIWSLKSLTLYIADDSDTTLYNINQKLSDTSMQQYIFDSFIHDQIVHEPGKHLIIPLHYLNLKLGVCYLEYQNNTFTLDTDDFESIKSIITILSSLVYNYFNLQKSAPITELEKLLNQIKQKIYSTLDLEQIMKVLEPYLFSFTGCEGYYLALINENHDNLTIEKAVFPEEFNKIESVLLKSQFALENSNVIKICMNSKKTLFLNSENLDEYGDNAKSIFSYWKLKSAMFIPLISNNPESLPIGILCLFTHYSFLDQKKINELEKIIKVFYEAIKNYQLFAQSKIIEERLKNTEIRNQKAIEIIESISKITSVDLIYQKILESIFKLFHFDIGLIFTEKNNFLEYTRGDYRKDSNAIEKFIAIDHYFKEQKGYELSMMDGATPVCYFRKSYLYFKNIEVIKNMPMSQKDKQGIELLETPISIFIVPFLKDQAPIGIIQFWTVEKEIDLSEHDQYIMNLLCSFIGTAITNSEIYSLVEKQKKELENKNKIIEAKNYQFVEELKLAKIIQQSLIPIIPEIPGVKLSALYKPMEDVGGDLYDFIKIRETNLFGIFISDVSGHGVPAALITSMVKTLVETAGEKRIKPAELLTFMNEKLVDQTGGNFLTAFYGVYDSSHSIFTYSKGAHNSPYIIRGSEIIPLEANGKVLAIWEDAAFEEKQIKLFPGDKILFYTDGLTEAVNSENEEFEEIMFSFLLENSHLSAQNLTDAIYHALLNHRGDYHFEDDVCILVMEIC